MHGNEWSEEMLAHVWRALSTNVGDEIYGKLKGLCVVRSHSFVLMWKMDLS